MDRQKGDQDWTGKLSVVLARLPERLRSVAGALREKAALRHEIQLLDEAGELDRVLADAGISADDIPDLLAAHPGADHQLADMMCRLGIDATRVPPVPTSSETLHDMERRCAACAAWRECRSWLASDKDDAAYHQFCPNAHALDEILRLKSARLAREEKSRGILQELDETRGQSL
jgi:hypothetical protein